MRTRILPFALFSLGAFLLCHELGPESRSTAHTDMELRVRMLYSGEKKDWLTLAATEFMKRRPGIFLELVSMDSMSSVSSLVSGEEEALVWSPASTAAVNLLRYEWSQKHPSEAFESDGIDAPQPLLLSPMVWLVWEDRAKVLAQLQQRLDPAHADSLSWKTVHAALTSEGGWQGIEGIQGIQGRDSWGSVKFGYTDPLQSNSGFQALYLMTMEFVSPARSLSGSALASPEYLEWLALFQASSLSTETSTSRMLNDMLRYGPSKYDLIMTYESHALMTRAHPLRIPWGTLRIFYPPATVWNDHPVVLLKISHWSDEQRMAARLWIEFLLSREMQQLAVEHGFRPADPTLPFKSTDPNKPDLFTRFEDGGVRLSIPSVPRVPTGAEAHMLLELWEREQPLFTLDGGLSP